MTQRAIDRYELWEEPDGYSFFASTNDAARRSLDNEAVLVWDCHATSFEEAQQKKHAHLGWEPYKSMHGEEST